MKNNLLRHKKETWDKRRKTIRNEPKMRVGWALPTKTEARIQ